MNTESCWEDPRAATTFPQLVRAAAAAYGDALAIALMGETVPDEAATFVELERKSAELARGLLARGVGKGTRIGFIAGNGPQYAVWLAAIARIGAVAVPISTLIKANELVRVLRQSDVSGLIVQRTLLGHDYVRRFCEALPALATTDDPELRVSEVPYLRWIVCTGASLPPAFRDMSFLAEAAATISEDLLSDVEANVHATDQMIEVYTSGSMALPKGVKHNHGPMLDRIHYIAEMWKVQRGAQRNAHLPMFWIGGMIMYLFPSWERGAVSLCTERTWTNSAKAMGAVLSDEELQQSTNGELIWSMGMTESIGPYAYTYTLRVPGYPLSPPLDHIVEGYEVRLWADGREAPEGVKGEIQVRGPAMTPGLHKVERSEHFEPDGFYRTGDMGIRQGSRILFVGRSGDMIKTASANVSPAEVEYEMQQLEGVASAYVVGVPDPVRGQLLVAAVVPREGATLDFADIEGKLRQRLSGFKVPRVFVPITREEVPMLHSNKIARREIERMMAEKLAAPSA